MISREKVILFDGLCNFCSLVVRFIIRHDRNNCFKFVPLQSPTGKILLAKHGIAPGENETIVLITHDGAYLKSDAVIAIAREFSGPFRMLAMIKYLPISVRDRIYSFFSKNRYAWFGARDTCMIPDKDSPSRFLDYDP